MQFIKGGFSFRAKKEAAFRDEVWQAGYNDTCEMLDRAPWAKPVDPTEGVIIHEPVESTTHLAEGVDGFAGRTR